jgi:hypothetical protein
MKKEKYKHWLLKAEEKKAKLLKKAEKTSIEQKLVKASTLLQEAALQFDKIGLKLTFDIKINAYESLFLGTGVNFATDPGKKPSPSK